MNLKLCCIALGVSFFAVPASADDTIKIGYIDPLSGGGASIGEVGLKTFQYLADEINAKGGLNGKKVEIVGLDNKTNPQESLIQAQKAADQGIQIITQGNGSSVARRARRTGSRNTMTAIPARRSSISITPPSIPS